MDKKVGMSPKVVLARQPIFDREYKVYAYELLFRSDSSQSQSNIEQFSGDLATSRVINHAFLDLGIERVIGQSLAFVNLTRNFVLSDDPIPFGQERAVLEILEDIEVDDELLEGVKQLVAQGYTIALDDFIFHENLRPLIELAHFIKVDLLALSDDELEQHVEILKKYDVKLLAEKVETIAQYKRCIDLGFDYFQGYFFCRPDIIEDKPIPNNKLNLLQILQKLQDPEVEFEEIEKLIAQDAGLSYKLLRLLNSAAMGMPRKIESIRQALTILGQKAIKNWVSLILMSEMNTGTQELVDDTLIRAKMAEKMAESYQFQAETGFLLGLFSTIDVMLSKPMAELVPPLPLSDEIKQALINRAGPAGELLKNVLHYERGEWDHINENFISLENMNNLYFGATEWMLDAKQAL